jgi:hypothetical protein
MLRLVAARIILFETAYRSSISLFVSGQPYVTHGQLTADRQDAVTPATGLL